MASDPNRSFLRVFLIVPAIALGAFIFVNMVKNSAEPEQAPAAERARPVRVITVAKTDLVPLVTGHGNVAPGKVWDAVVEVGGKIVEEHPRLKKGDILPADTVILRIDPSNYENAIAQSQASLNAAAAQLAQIDVSEANTNSALKIEQEALALGAKELERKRKLAEQRTLPRSEYDQEQRTYLSLRQSVQTQQNALNIYPVERQRLEAELARYQSQLDSARLDLERTTISLPFAGRISAVNVERGQYVSPGQVLASVDGIAVAEVEAQIPMNRMRTLINGSLSPEATTAATELTEGGLGLSARVVLRDNGIETFWPARVARISDTLDPITRTVGIIVEVDEPYANVNPGVRPPMVKGLFVSVELRGQSLSEQIIVPRSALLENTVYIVDQENRLRMREVKTALLESEFAVINAGLEAGERVVVSDLSPAIDGMLLTPIDDPDLQARLVQAASAEAAPQ